MNRFNHVLGFSIVLYLLFLFAFPILIGNKESIPAYMYVMQLFMAAAFFIMMGLSQKLYAKDVICIIPIFLLIFTYLLRYEFALYTGDIYNNTDGCDTYRYERIALLNQNSDYQQFINSCFLDGLNVDDLGYSSIYWFATSYLQGIQWARVLISLINAVAILFSSIYIYRICQMIGISKKLSLVSASFYGSFPFFIVSSAMGLKENIFCSIIVVSLYYMYQYKESGMKYCAILSLIAILLTIFFRNPITLMLLIVFILMFFCNEQNKKKSLWIMFFLAMVVYIFLPIILFNFSGRSLEMVRNVANERVKHSGYIPQMLAAFFGPFPNFTRTAQYGILHNSGLLTKCIMGFWAWIGGIFVIKNLEYRLYPIIAYLTMGVVMLVLSGVALDMRYHVTFFVSFVIISAYGMQHSKSSHTKWFVLYSLGIVGIIWMYNLR